MTTHLLKFVAVIIAVCVPALAVGKEKTVSKTQIREAYFTINLPKGWVGGPGPDPTLWQYASPKQNEQLSVSIHVSKTPISKQERPKVLNDFLAMRLKSETEQAKSKGLKISEPTREEKGNGWRASYSGVHPKHGAGSRTSRWLIRSLLRTSTMRLSTCPRKNLRTIANKFLAASALQSNAPMS
jgi:hypothetical protein